MQNGGRVSPVSQSAVDEIISRSRIKEFHHLLGEDRHMRHVVIAMDS
jgi:hypothetical protein